MLGEIGIPVGLIAGGMMILGAIFQERVDVVLLFSGLGLFVVAVVCGLRGADVLADHPDEKPSAGPRPGSGG